MSIDVIWKPFSLSNYWPGRGQRKVAIVCHTTGGSLAATDGWFNNPNASASTNYAIGLNGEIHGYVDPFGPDAPYANGLVRLPSGNFPAMLAAQGNENPNYWTVSIEHEGFPTPSIPTPEMFAASVNLAAYICQACGIPADRQHFFSHTEIDNQKPDPGWSEQFWGVYLAAVNAAINGGDDMTPAPWDAMNYTMFYMRGHDIQF